MPNEVAPVIMPADADDAADILALVHAAFRPIAERLGVPTLEPLEETEEETRRAIVETVVLKACVDGRLVGSVRGDVAEGTCKVGRLVVDPRMQRRGIGRSLLVAVEENCPDAERFELFTGVRNGAQKLYESLGYRAFRKQRLSEKLELVFMEKLNRP